VTFDPSLTQSSQLSVVYEIVGPWRATNDYSKIVLDVYLLFAIINATVVYCLLQHGQFRFINQFQSHTSLPSELTGRYINIIIS
jgi:hypothetical protein